MHDNLLELLTDNGILGQYENLYVGSLQVVVVPNGLLRQYFPKGSDLSVHSEADLDAVAAELNNRPRQRLNLRKPIDEIGPLLLQ